MLVYCIPVKSMGLVDYASDSSGDAEANDNLAGPSKR